MKNHYTISIPKPCHEDWNSMTPKEQGRFCHSCVKTVVDFTKMNTEDVQEFIKNNKHKRICGHFKQTQLDSINLRIPSQVLTKPKGFHNTFLLALFMVMGTTLINCTNNKGGNQKIDSIEIVDTFQNKVIDSLEFIKQLPNIDTLNNKTCTRTINVPELQNPTGIVIVDPVGEVVIDTLNTAKEPEIEVDGLIEVKDDLNTKEAPILFGIIATESSPQFKDTPSNLKGYEKKDYFSKRISQFVNDNFNITGCPETLKGLQKIYTRFKINKDGQVTDIQVRAPHISLKEEAIRVLKLLPEFIPAQQRDEPRTTLFNLPIIFKVEE